MRRAIERWSRTCQRVGTVRSCAECAGWRRSVYGDDEAGARAHGGDGG